MTFPFPLMAPRAAGVPLGLGALVYMSADWTGQDFNPSQFIGFDSEVYDHGGWHDAASNNSRLTVPAGVGYVMVSGQVGLANINSNEQQLVRLYKNGSQVTPNCAYEDTTAGAPVIQVQSYPLAVSAGDYFQIDFFTSTDASADILAARTWFAIRRLD